MEKESDSKVSYNKKLHLTELTVKTNHLHRGISSTLLSLTLSLEYVNHAFKFLEHIRENRRNSGEKYRYRQFLTIRQYLKLGSKSKRRKLVKFLIENCKRVELFCKTYCHDIPASTTGKCEDSQFERSVILREREVETTVVPSR